MTSKFNNFFNKWEYYMYKRMNELGTCWRHIKTSQAMVKYLKKNYTCINFIEDYYDYEDRMDFCNWQELYEKGNWQATQKQVEKALYYNLDRFIKAKNRSQRFWTCDYPYIKDVDLLLYVFGRDIFGYDLVITLKRRNSQ